jgi:hypothetical protein
MYSISYAFSYLSSPTKEPRVYISITLLKKFESYLNTYCGTVPNKERIYFTSHIQSIENMQNPLLLFLQNAAMKWQDELYRAMLSSISQDDLMILLRYMHR